MKTKHIEIKISKYGKEKWTEHLKEGVHDELAIQLWLERVVENHPSLNPASYRIMIKENGGYSKNHETGGTLIQTVKCKPQTLFELLNVKENENPTRLEILEEEIKRENYGKE